MPKYEPAAYRAEGVRFAVRDGGDVYYAIWYDEGREFAKSTGIKREGRIPKRALTEKARQLREEQREAARRTKRTEGLITLAELSDLDFDRMEAADRNPGHVKTTVKRWLALLEFYGESATLADVSTASVTQLVAKLRGEKNKMQTIKRYLVQLKRAFDLAADQGQLFDQPRWPDLGKDDEESGRFVDPDDVRRVVGYMLARAQRYERSKKSTGRRAKQLRRTADLVLWGLNTGMRRTECERLRSEWITERGAELPRSATKIKKPRCVPLTDEARSVLERRGVGLVFGPGEYRKGLAYSCRALGLEPFDLRDLRHTCATLVGRETGDRRMLMEWFGWSNGTTADRYLHTQDDWRDAVSLQLSRQLTQTKKKTPSDVSKMARPEGFEPTTFGFVVRSRPSRSRNIRYLALRRHRRSRSIPWVYPDKNPDTFLSGGGR